MPTTTFGTRKWLKCRNVAHEKQGKRFVFNLCDLPEDIRTAYLTRQIELAGLDTGTYDEAAHDQLRAAPASMQTAAERRAAITRLLVKLGDSVSWKDRRALVCKEFGTKGNSIQSLKRLFKEVENTDPINFAPALLQGHKGRTVKADIADELWELWLGIIQKSAPSHALTAVYDDVQLIADKKGLAWPSYPTILRRWNALPEIERTTLRHGGKHAAKELYQPQRRSVAKVQAMQVVEMDGRTLDIWAEFEDGTIARPTMIALVDRASFKGLHFVIGKGETALLTRDLILETCDRYGIFDQLLTDNSRSFSGLLVAGGVKHKFRNSGSRLPEWEPPGVCEHLGIELKFTLPHNPGAKIPESKFAKWSRRIDTRPEFAGAHSGHNPLDKPNGNETPVPIALVREIYAREMARDNAKAGRRTQNARKGESYDQTFNRLLQSRIHRPMQPKQRWRASLLYQVRTVDRLGQIRVNGWVYGKDSLDGSQERLLPYAGLPVLIGTDPSNYAAPAIAFDMDTRREIMAGIQPDLEGDYMDQDGAREASKERARLRKITREIETRHSRDLSDFYADLNDGRDLGCLDDPARANVVKPNFKDPIRAKANAKSEATERAERQEFLVRMKAEQNERKASGGTRQPF